MRKYFVFISPIILALSGAGFLLLAQSSQESANYPDAREYAPNLWFDSEEKYYPADPLDFYYDEDGNELPGKTAVSQYDMLSLDEKLKQAKVFYKVDDTGDEFIYQYWLFYVMNNYENGHYGDWESLFVFVDKESKNINKAIGSAHGSGHKLEIKSEDTRHIWVYVGNGSHANCPDEVGYGKCNFSIWNFEGQGFEWTKEDIANGKKISSANYLLYELGDSYTEQFQNKNSFSTEKSPTLGINPYKSLDLLGIPRPKGDKYYNLPLIGNHFGKTPTFAWEKEEYHHPEKMLESAPTRIAKKVNGFFEGMGSAIAGVGKTINLPAPKFFTASVTTKDEETIQESTEEVGESEVRIAEEFKDDDVRGFTPAGGETPAPAPALPLTPIPSLIPTRTPADPETAFAFVKKVIDGDTFELASGQRVRYIGIDAPEDSLECYAEEAKQRNKSLIEGKRVILLKSPDHSDKDKYDRLLRFVWLDYYQDGKIDSTDTFTNLDLVERGYARENDYGEAHEYKHRFKSAEAEAKRQELGLWGKACNEKLETIKESGRDIVQTAEKIAEDLRGEASTLRPFEIAPNVFKFPVSSGGGSAPTPIPTPTPSPTPAPEPEATTTLRLVINEVQTGDAEFVELYNQSSSAKSLAGYYFSYFPSSKTAWNDPWRNQKFPDSASILANSYYLIGLKDYATSGGNPNTDWQPYSSAQLSNTAGTVAIFSFDPSATTSVAAYSNRADAVGWGSGLTLYEQSSVAAPDSGKSITRNSSHADTDDNSSNFSLSASSTPINSSGTGYDPNFSYVPLWAMYQKDAKHSGLAALAGPSWTNSSQATSSWTFQMVKSDGTNTGGRAQAVIDYAGNIYATDSYGIVHKISSIGVELWAFNPDDQGGVGAGYAAASPALSLDSSRIYSVYTDNTERKLWLFSIKTSDGSLDWKYAPSEDGYNQSITSPMADSSGAIYYASQQSTYSVSSSGVLNWEKNLSPSRLGLKIPALDNSGGYVYVSGIVSLNAGDRYIWKLNKSDGSEVWKENPTGNNNLSNGISLSATGTIYTGGNNDSRLYSVSPTNGSKNWNRILVSGSVKSPVPNFDSSGNIYIGASGAFDSGALNKVSATGTLLWYFSGASLGASSHPAVVDGSGRVYYGAKDKYIYALKSEDGSEIWKYQLSGEPVGFAIGKDVVYTISYDGKVYALK